MDNPLEEMTIARACLRKWWRRLTFIESLIIILRIKETSWEDIGKEFDPPIRADDVEICYNFGIKKMRNFALDDEYKTWGNRYIQSPFRRIRRNLM